MNFRLIPGDNNLDSLEMKSSLTKFFFVYLLNLPTIIYTEYV